MDRVEQRKGMEDDRVHSRGPRGVPIMTLAPGPVEPV